MHEGSVASVSIALCTFNGAPFLHEQLRSFLSQSRQPDELVVCDDGSTDDTAAVIARFARRARFPVRFSVNKERLGSTRNFEKAIALCTGDLIALSDQDDVWHPDKLLLQERALCTASIGAVFTDAEVVGADLAPLGYSLWDSVGFSLADRQRVEQGQALRVLLRRDVATGTTMMFRSGYRDAVLPIPDRWVHDGWIALIVAILGGLGFLERPLVRYRQHGANQIGASRPMTGPSGFLQRLRAAREGDRAILVDDLCRFRAAHRRLGALGANEEVLADLEGKLMHLDRRVLLPEGAGRVPVILREFAGGRYRRWSRGWQSAAKDLVFPP